MAALPTTDETSTSPTDDDAAHQSVGSVCAAAGTVRGRTAHAVARQQAGWLSSGRTAGALTASEVQLVRFAALYDHVRSFGDWKKRHDDLAAAACDAGLLNVDSGWAQYADEPIPWSRWGHPTVSDEADRKAFLLASAWAWYAAPRRRLSDATMRYDRENPCQLVDAYMWQSSPTWTWAYWCCHVHDGDTASGVTARTLAAWVTAQKIPRRKRWSTPDLMAAQHLWAWDRRQPRVDEQHLRAAAAELDMRLT